MESFSIKGAYRSLTGQKSDKEKRREDKERREENRYSCCIGATGTSIDRDKDCPEDSQYYDRKCEPHIHKYCTRCMINTQEIGKQDQVEDSVTKEDVKGLFGGKSIKNQKALFHGREVPFRVLSYENAKCENPYIFSKKICQNYCKYNNSSKKWCDNIKKDYCKDKIFSDKNCQTFCADNEKWCNSIKANLCNKTGDLNDECQTFCDEKPELCDVRFRDMCPTSNSDTCVYFCNTDKYSHFCKQQASNYCNEGDENIETEFCQNFCMKEDNFGWCDGGMDKFCKKHPDDPKCACINSPLHQDDDRFNVLCVDTKCSDGGYGTSSMLASRGDSCEIVDCSQELNISDIEAGGGVFISPEYKQQCMIEKKTTNIDSDTVNTGVNDDDVDDQDELEDNQQKTDTGDEDTGDEDTGDEDTGDEDTGDEDTGDKDVDDEGKQKNKNLFKITGIVVVILLFGIVGYAIFK